MDIVKIVTVIGQKALAEFFNAGFFKGQLVVVIRTLEFETMLLFVDIPGAGLVKGLERRVPYIRGATARSVRR